MVLYEKVPKLYTMMFEAMAHLHIAALAHDQEGLAARVITAQVVNLVQLPLVLGGSPPRGQLT